MRSQSDRLPNSLRNFTGPVLIFVALFIAFLPSFERPGGTMDEGMLLVYPELVQRGQLPYRDFETFYGPANPFLLSIPYAIFGTHVFVERACGLAYRLLILAALFALFRRWNGVIAAGCTLIAGFLLLPTELIAFAWMGAMACVLWSIRILRNVESDKCCSLGGVLAGVALLFRADIAPAVILATLPMLHLMSWSRRWKCFCGFAITLSPLAILTAVVGPQQIANNLFLYPVLYSNPGRHLPILGAEDSILCLFFAHLIAGAVNLVAGAMAVRNDSRAAQARVLVGLALFGLALTPQAAQRLDLLHVLFASFISIGVLPASVAILAARGAHVAESRSRMLLAVVLVIALLEATAPKLALYVRHQAWAGVTAAPGEGVFIQNRGRSFPMSSSTALFTSALIAEVETKSEPGQRLFVGPGDLRRTYYGDTFIYYLLPQLRPATYFLEMNPLSANRPNSRLATDVKSADWLILDRGLDFPTEPNLSRQFGSDAPNQVVNAEFVLHRELGRYRIYRHKRPDELRR